MPLLLKVPIADLMTGMYATIGILAALTRRDRGGGGEYIDMSLLDCQIATLSNQGQNWLISGLVPKRYGNAHPTVVPYQSFPTGDGHIIIAIGNDFQFGKFCQVGGRPALADDERFSTNAARVRHRDELAVLMTEMVCTRSTNEWLSVLGPLGVPCGPINRVDQAFAHEQVRYRGMRIDLPHPSSGSVPLIASPIRYTEHPIAYGTAPPTLGQHTDEVLGELLQMNRDDVDALRQCGVV